MSLHQETQFQHGRAIQIMGSDGTPCHSQDGTVLHWSWNEEEVMQALGETDFATFFIRCIELNLYTLSYARLCVYAAPEGHDADGSWWEAPNPAYPKCPYQNWRDGAIEEVGSVDITSAGVLLLHARSHKGV